MQAVSAAQSGRLDELIEQARKHADQLKLAEMERQRADLDERRRHVRSVGVIYEAPRLDVEQLLEAVGAQHGREPSPASFKQVLALRAAGLDVPDSISRENASTLFNLVEKRRAAGLCTIKQARKLRSYGLRDDVSFPEARAMLDAIAANKWQAPAYLLNDARLRAPAA